MSRGFAKGHKHSTSVRKGRDVRNARHGNVPMRKMSDAELQARIDAVVAKAKTDAGSGVDVIREIRQIRYLGLKAYRVG